MVAWGRVGVQERSGVAATHWLSKI
jgi:hypothetical protein